MWRRKPLYGQIVLAAKASGVAGATVMRGIEGLGKNAHLRTGRILRPSEDIPVIVEIVDKPEKIEAFLDEISELLHDVVVTVQHVEMNLCGPRDVR